MEKRIKARIKTYIDRLNKKKAQGIIYENMGYEWDIEFGDWLTARSLSYSEKVMAEQSFYQAISAWYSNNY